MMEADLITTAETTVATADHKIILIVEDDADIREVLQMILETEGYTVLTARNGEEGLRVILNTGLSPSLVLLDLQMPIMNGQEFLKHLRSNPQPRFNGIPVVVLSAARTEVIDMQANDRLAKPIDVDSLMKVVEKFCVASASNSISQEAQHEI